MTFRNIQPGVDYAISICTIINGKSISERVVIPQRNLGSRDPDDLSPSKWMSTPDF